jgi:hypothetical protein
VSQSLTKNCQNWEEKVPILLPESLKFQILVKCISLKLLQPEKNVKWEMILLDVSPAAAVILGSDSKIHSRLYNGPAGSCDGGSGLALNLREEEERCSFYCREISRLVLGCSFPRYCETRWICEFKHWAVREPAFWGSKK